MNKAHSLRFISLLLIILACCLGLISCTYRSNDQAHAATRTPLSSTNHQQCGTIALFPNSKVIDEKTSSQKATCFTQAYYSCKVATLLFSASGVDTITSHTFTVVKNQPHCLITDLVQFRVVPMPPKNTGSYTCASLLLTKDALSVLHCGAEGTITIPLHN
jgi:hypothetical protein